MHTTKNPLWIVNMHPIMANTIPQLTCAPVLHVVTMSDLPLIRSHERIDFKRCQMKWYWHWRLGLTPKAKEFGALELGSWVHLALAQRYGNQRKMGLYHWFNAIAGEAIRRAHIAEVPDHLIAQAKELAKLGLAMADAYDVRYGKDPGVRVLAAELPLEFPIANSKGEIIAVHKLKPDLVYADENDDVWLMEHKTAASIRTDHLVIDDQARPYVAMAGPALVKAGVIKHPEQFKGVMYNFLRKAVPDSRPVNEKGEYLNKNGTVSAKQPAPYFVRHPVVLTRKSRANALRRLQLETRMITDTTRLLRSGEITPAVLTKTPHSSCAKFCQYFAVCVVDEDGGDIREMQRSMYVQQNPYLYDEENPTADVPVSFEFG